jgi:hypothetical protein
LSETSSQVQFNNDESERLDKYLVSRFPDYSRSQLQRLIGDFQNRNRLILFPKIFRWKFFMKTRICL